MYCIDFNQMQKRNDVQSLIEVMIVNNRYFPQDRS